MEPVPEADAGPRRAPRLALAGASVLLVVLVVAATLLVSGRGDDRAAAAPAATPTPKPTVTVPDVYKQVGPSVVVVRTAKGSLGTGAIVGEDGTVLTANHVVSDRSAVIPIFADGTKSAATVAAADPKHDVATLLPGAAVPSAVAVAGVAARWWPTTPRCSRWRRARVGSSTRPRTPGSCRARCRTCRRRSR